MVNKIFGVKQNFLPHKLHLTGSEKFTYPEKKKNRRVKEFKGRKNHYYFFNIRNNAMCNCDLPLAFPDELTPLSCYVLIIKLKTFKQYIL